MLRHLPSSASKRESMTPSKRQVFGKATGGLQNKASSPMTPAKVRERRESERRSMMPNKMDMENIAPLNARASVDVFAGKVMAPGGADADPMELAENSTRTSPLQEKDDLRPSPVRSSVLSFDAEALMKMSPMSTNSPAGRMALGCAISPGEKASQDLEQQLVSLKVEEGALDALHGQLRSALSKTASSSRLSISDVDKRGKEQMREMFEELEASQSALRAENERLKFELEEAALASESAAARLEEMQTMLSSKEKELEAANDTETELRMSLDETVSQATALRLSLAHSQLQGEEGTGRTAEMEEELRNLRTSFADAMELSQRLKGDLQGAKETIFGLEQELGEKQVQAVQAEDEVRRLKGMGTEFISNILDVQKELDEEKKALEEARGSLESKEEELSKVQCMLKDTRTVLQETRVKLEDTSTERNMWRDQANSGEVLLAETVSRLEVDLEEARMKAIHAKEMMESCFAEAEVAREKHQIAIEQLESRLDKEQKSTYDMECRQQLEIVALTERLNMATETLEKQEEQLIKKDQRIDTLAECSDSLEKLQSEYHTMISGLKKDLAVADSALQVHVREISDLKLQMEGKEGVIEGLEREMAQVQEGLSAEVDKVRSQLAFEQEQSAGHVEIAQDEISELKVMLAERDRLLTSAKRETSEAIKGMEEMEHNNMKLQSQSQGWLKELESEQQKASELARQLGNALVEADRASGQVEKLEVECKKLEVECQKLEGELRESNSKCDGLSEEKRNLVARLVESELEVKGLKKQGEEQSRQVLDLLNNLDKSKAAADAAVSELQNELKAALEAYEAAKDELSHLRRISSELNSTEDMLTEMQSQLDKYQQSLSTSHQTRRDLEGILLARDVELKAETERRQKLEEELASMEEEKADFIATCASLREKLDTEQYTLEFLRQECDSREQMWSDAFASLKDWSKRRVDGLHDDAERTHGLSEELAKDLESLRAAFEAEAQEHRCEMEDAREELEEMTARFEEAAMEAQKQHKSQVSRLDESLVAAQTRAEQVEAELNMSIQKVQGGLEREVAKLQKQVAELKAHDADACAKVLRIEGEIADKEEERMRLCEVVEEQEAKRQGAEQEAVSLKQKLEEAETVRQVKEREMRAVKAKCDELEKERAASMEELENLEGQMARTLDSMQALINSKDREVAELREELEGACEAQVHVDAQQDAACALQDQLFSSEQARLDLEGRLLEEAERIKGLSSEKEHLEGLLTAAAESVYAEQARVAELETRLQRLRDSRVEEEVVYQQISKMPGKLCDTLQQVCSEMVRSKAAEDGRRAKERKLFYGELNNAHTMLSDTEAALQKQTESVHELSGKLREAMEGRQSAENSLAAMAEAREADMTEREAITDNSRLLQSKIEKYGVLMSTLDFNPWETPSKGVARVRDMVEELGRRGEEIEALKVDLEGELVEKEQLMEQLSQDFSNLKAQVVERQGMLDEEMHLNKELEADKAHLEARLAQLQEHIVHLEGNLERQVRQGNAALEHTNELVNQKTRILNDSQAQVALLQRQLDQVKRASAAKEEERLRMSRALSQLEATCQQQEQAVFEKQDNMQRLSLERAELEKQRDELQQHYMSACQDLLRESTGSSQARREGRNAMLSYNGSSTPQDVKAPKRTDATHRRLAAASPEVAAVLQDGQLALTEMSSDKAELEKRVSILQQNLDEEVQKRSSVEMQLSEVTSMMAEERQVVLEERERMIEEMTSEKRRLLLAFSDMLTTSGKPVSPLMITAPTSKCEEGSQQHGPAANDSASGVTRPYARFEARIEVDSEAGSFNSAREPSNSTFEWDVRSDGGEAAAASEPSAEAKVAKIKAVVIRLGGKVTEDGAKRLLEHARWDTAAAVKLARKASGAVQRHMRKSMSGDQGELLDVSVIFGRPSVDDGLLSEADSKAASKRDEKSPPPGLSFLSAKGELSKHGASQAADLDVDSMYAEAALQASKETPIERYSISSAHGRMSLSLSPESMVRKSLNGPRFLF